MAKISLLIEVAGKKVQCLLSRPSATHEPRLRFGLVLGHGASGDSRSGNLPAIAEYCASVGLLTLRYDAKGPLTSRIKVLQASHWVRSTSWQCSYI